MVAVTSESRSEVEAGLVARLADAVGCEHVLTDPTDVAGFTTDWTRRFAGPARAVVRPADTDQVAAVVGVCVAAGVPVLPQGGNTGLVGGSTPAARAGPAGPPVIVSTTRLSALGPVEEWTGQVTAGAGATLGALQAHARAAGWSYQVDLAARDSATVGGMVATNAGGIRVCAYGMTRAQVLGIEAVLPDGSVISHLSGLLKDNTGYDLAGLLVGSEGTLGIVTAARLRLHRPPPPSTVVLVGVPSYQAALHLLSTAVAAPLLAAELVDATGLELVIDLTGLPYPLAGQHSLVLLLEVADGGTADGLRLPADADAVVAVERGDQARLWSYRERQSEAFSALGIVHKLDVSIPAAVLAACAADLRTAAHSAPGVTHVGVFGHLADGNVHVEIAGPAADDERADLAVLRVVAGYGGSISAEHGIGRAKAAHLGLCRSPAELAAMRAIKAAWDPYQLFNPGVMLT